jgi:DNA-binding MarR family transcriptional regulator
MTEAELNECLEQLHFGFRRLVEGPDRQLAALGLGRAHHRVLFFVRREVNPSVGALASVLKISIQALHRVTRDLMRLKFVQSFPDRENGRIRRLTLTASGKALESDLSGAQRDMFKVALEKVSSRDLKGWSKIMAELARE